MALNQSTKPDNTSEAKQPTAMIHAQFVLKQKNKGADGFSLDINVDIPGRGVTAIFGESGSGKTTFLRCVAGLEKAPQGNLVINGSTWQDNRTFLPTHKRPLGYVFLEASLFPHLSAQGNLNYAIKRSDEPVSEEFYEKVVSTMGIKNILTRLPNQLSGGERQRVAIARALLIQPRILLMDEPLAALDNKRKQEILPYLERLHNSFDIPILYVSHSMDEVARLSDHVVVLHEGKVSAQGSLKEVFSRMDSPVQFTQESGVILQGRIVEKDSQWNLMSVAFSGGKLWLHDSGEAINEPVRIRVLARDLSLALNNHNDTSILNRLEAEVLEVAPGPNNAMAMVRLKAGDDYLIARVTHRSVAHLDIKPGKKLLAQIKSVAIVS